MRLAQQLYEGVDFGEGAIGLITYMRTDSPNLSDEAMQEIRAYCESQQWPVAPKPRVWQAKVSAQEAPIRFVEPKSAMPFWDLLRHKVELLPS